MRYFGGISLSLSACVCALEEVGTMENESGRNKQVDGNKYSLEREVAKENTKGGSKY